MHDVAIVGAGPAGLSAALILGRCRRDVVVFDSGQPRNAASRGLHGFITRDGMHPMMLRQLARAELAQYPSVTLHDVTVSRVNRQPEGFELQLDNGSSVRCRMLLLATGRADELPAKPGFRELYGRGVYHCPICDGWEHRDRPLATYGRGEDAFELAFELLTWSSDVTLCTDGPSALSPAQRSELAANGIGWREEEVAELVAGTDDMLATIHFREGRPLPCRALFFAEVTPQRSSFPEALGCRFGPSGGVVCERHAATGVPGLFVAGNVRCGIHLAITAAAEGAEAALAINDALCACRRRG